MDEFPTLTGDIDWQGGSNSYGMVRGRDNNIVMFYNKPMPNPLRSQELGRLYSEDKVFLKMHAPGEHSINVIDRPAVPADARRWPVEWAQFKNNQEQITPGTQIELLFYGNPAVGANLRAQGIHTVEQLAALSGTAIDRVGMGAQQWVNDAQEYLKSAEKGVHYTHMKSELEKRDGEIRVLKRQVEELSEKLGSLAQGPGQIAGLPPSVTPQQLWQMMAGIMQNPQMPPPGVEPSKAFDAQAVQIAATHPSIDEARGRRRRKTPI